MADRDWGADTQDVMLSVWFQDGARQKTSSDSKGCFFFTSWRCLRTLTCLGKQKKNIRFVSRNILAKVSNLSCRMQRVCCMGRKSPL